LAQDGGSDGSDDSGDEADWTEDADGCGFLGAASPRTMHSSGVSEPSYETMDIPHRFKSPVLLLWGGVFGVMGFVVAFCIGLLNFFTRHCDFNGVAYKSGNGYWPATVSEMVYEWNSAEGRIFFGFCLISAFLIFQSWYPYELRNVFTGHEVARFGCGISMYWITFRQMVPVVGLLLLISVSTVPSAIATISDQFCIAVHLLGAFMMFVGYIAAELKCLQMCWMRGAVQAKYLDIEGDERIFRRWLMVVVLVFYTIFCMAQVALVVGASMKPPLCCADVYLRTHNENFSLAKAIKDTASGSFLTLKVISFVSEVVSGLALICSHIVIWYYCEERLVNFAEDGICMVYDEENLIELHRDGNSVYMRNPRKREAGKTQDFGGSPTARSARYAGSPAARSPG